jgi:anti-sigma28 factor (negative regulator of flagellin synthesis)
MKVNDPNLAGMTPDSIGGAGLNRAQPTDMKNRQGGAGAGTGIGDSPDSVSLSGLGSQLRAMTVDSPERLQRLEKLSADVETNRYQVDAHKVGDRLIEDAIRPAA